MIKVYRAKKELRKRDEGQKRFILQLGRRKFRLTFDELEKIVNKGMKFMPYSGCY